MRNVQLITVEHFVHLLNERGASVQMNSSMPIGEASENYTAFRAILNENDINRVFLWLEFRKYTDNPGSKLIDIQESAREQPRVRSFMYGDPMLGYAPIDLRTAANKEPMLVTSELHTGPLYVVDGNHRMMSQFLAGTGLEGIPVFVLNHPRMLEWNYMGDVRRDWKGI